MGDARSCNLLSFADIQFERSRKDFEMYLERLNFSEFLAFEELCDVQVSSLVCSCLIRIVRGMRMLMTDNPTRTLTHPLPLGFRVVWGGFCHCHYSLWSRQASASVGGLMRWRGGEDQRVLGALEEH